jgi:hypothetical protein
MFELLKSDKPGLGVVYFSGAAPSAAQIEKRLRAAGMQVVPSEKGRGKADWAFGLCHEDHGSAIVLLEPEAPPAAGFLQYALGLTESEAALAQTGTGAVLVVVAAEHDDVLRDRKRLLWFMRRVMGSDGVLGVDLASRLPWSPAALDDELAHDAPLDVEALYVCHAVPGKNGRVGWLHTHGLAELGGFDLDIVRPDPWLFRTASDPLRALAWAVAQGKLTTSTESFALADPGGKIRLVPAAAFMAQAAAADRAFRDSGPDTGDPHATDRAVVCEPRTPGAALAGAMPMPSRLLSRAQDGMTLVFDEEAAAMMAERALGTVGVLRSLMEEFAEWPVVPTARLVFPILGSDASELITCQVHAIGEDTIDCTLTGQPTGLPIREGLRSSFSLNRLADWTILSPEGDMTPRSLLGARRLRELPAEARDEMITLKRLQIEAKHRRALEIVEAIARRRGATVKSRLEPGGVGGGTGG